MENCLKFPREKHVLNIKDQSIHHKVRKKSLWGTKYYKKVSMLEYFILYNRVGNRKKLNEISALIFAYEIRVINRDINGKWDIHI